MWTKEEKQRLIELYPNHTNKEMCEILNKTAGQVRSMKYTLGLNSKLNYFTEDEKIQIQELYLEHPDSMDLDSFAKKLGRPKTNISRYARKFGLTKYGRALTEEQSQKRRDSYSAFMETDKYKYEVFPKMKENLLYILNNKHPRGMLGKHHSPETCKSISESHKKLWEGMSPEDRRQFSKRLKDGRIRNGIPLPSKNAYSRCHGGIRDDLGEYFRSGWEANVARYFNKIKWKWKYEPQRFMFEDSGDGILSYCPDFYIKNNNFWVEVKGWMDEKSKIRLQKFAKYYPEEASRLLIIDECGYEMIKNQYADTIENWEQ